MTNIIMCFDKDTSINAFYVGIVSGIVLIAYGEKTQTEYNKIIGFFFMFVSLMQLIEYMIWIDLSCENTNKVAGYVGPLLNNLQPTVLFLLAFYYGKIDDKPSIVIANLLYVVYVLSYYDTSNVCSNVQNGHISWAWKNSINYLFYNLIMITNILAINNHDTYVAFILAYIYFAFSVTNYRQHVGEIWCYTVVSIPIVIFIYQKLRTLC